MAKDIHAFVGLWVVIAMTQEAIRDLRGPRASA